LRGILEEELRAMTHAVRAAHVERDEAVRREMEALRRSVRAVTDGLEASRREARGDAERLIKMMRQSEQGIRSTMGNVRATVTRLQDAVAAAPPPPPEDAMDIPTPLETMVQGLADHITHTASELSHNTGQTVGNLAHVLGQAHGASLQQQARLGEAVAAVDAATRRNHAGIVEVARAGNAAVAQLLEAHLGPRQPATRHHTDLMARHTPPRPAQHGQLSRAYVHAQDLTIPQLTGAKRPPPTPSPPDDDDYAVGGGAARPRRPALLPPPPPPFLLDNDDDDL
jgi:hypothetical protein